MENLAKNSNLAKPLEMEAKPTENRTFHIYKITSPSGRVYIGVSRNIELRERNYRNYECVNQKILYNSLKKYGWENHSFDILDEFISNDDYALGKEMFWIRSFMSCYNVYPDQRGLNATMGGSGNFGLKMSEETKLKISKGNKGKKRTEEVKKKYSDAKKGVNTYWPTEETKAKMSSVRMGMAQSEETKRKLSEWRTGRKFPNINYHTEKRVAMYKALYKKVLQYDLNGNFLKEHESVQSAALETGVSKGTISGCAKGIIKTPTKFIFKFK